jgi:L-amino acid N-acyltransferase YncA
MTHRTIRLARASDATAIQAIYAPIVRETAISFELEVPSISEMTERIAHKLEHYPWLVLEGDGEVLGYAYAGRWRERAAYQWMVEVSVYVHPAHQRIGAGRALYTALFAALSLQGYRGAVAGIALPNDASIRLHQAVGFTAVGTYHQAGYKFGRWHDISWWERRLESVSNVVVPPLALMRIVGSEQWQAAMEAGERLLRR